MHRTSMFAALATAALLLPTYDAQAKPKAPVKGSNKPMPTAIANSSNEFAVAMYKKLSVAEKGNLFLSPYSVASALSMLYAGAKGDTRLQMSKVLHFWIEGSYHHESVQALNTNLEKDAADNKYSLQIANRLWAETSMKSSFVKDFLELNKKYYGAGTEMVDFTKDPEGAVKKINQWTKEKTGEKIPEIVKVSDVKDQGVAMILTNAIYFKGDWVTKFNKASTKSETFYLGLTETSKADMMSVQSEFFYTEDKDAQVLFLPYQGNQLEMMVVLPIAKDGLATIEKWLTVEEISTWVDNKKKQELKVKLPKFKLESSFDLGDQLTALGMKDAFTGKANFSGISTKTLKVSKVLHKGFMEVNEEGSEAAAATAVVMTKAPSIMETKAFTADHPFLFVIRDADTGVLLFMGRMVKP